MLGCVCRPVVGDPWVGGKRVHVRWGWGELGVGRVAHASTRLCSDFISLFQKCVSNHPGPPPLLWTPRNCETHTAFSARLSQGIHT